MIIRRLIDVPCKEYPLRIRYIKIVTGISQWHGIMFQSWGRPDQQRKHREFIVLLKYTSSLVVATVDTVPSHFEEKPIDFGRVRDSAVGLVLGIFSSCSDRESSSYFWWKMRVEFYVVFSSQLFIMQMYACSWKIYVKPQMVHANHARKPRVGFRRTRSSTSVTLLRIFQIWPSPF